MPSTWPTGIGRFRRDRTTIERASRKRCPGPCPQDPRQFNALWNQLTREEKDWLYSQEHGIGNHPGMPWDPPDHLGKDHYNRLHLAELAQQSPKSDVDGIQRTLDDAASVPHVTTARCMRCSRN